MKTGRPPAKIDPVELEKLCAMQATDIELAHWFKVSVSTIDRIKRKPATLLIMQRGKAMGCISLRRKQMQVAEAGNVTMLIWLGKQLLGQRDQIDSQISGAAGGAIELNTTARSELLGRIHSITERKRAEGSS